MKRIPGRFIVCCLISVLLAALTVGYTACSNSTNNNTLSSIAITPTSPDNLKQGYTQQFVATGTYTIGLTDDISNSVTWSSSDPAVATISPYGLATAVGAGTANIMATMSGVTSPPVSLTAITLLSIAVIPSSPPDLAIKSSQVFKAIGTYSDNSTADISYHAAWASSDTNIAAVSSLGVATGKAAGTANITAAISTITSPPVRLKIASP